VESLGEHESQFAPARQTRTVPKGRHLFRQLATQAPANGGFSQDFVALKLHVVER
jgi:hypothetical protein